MPHSVNNPRVLVFSYHFDMDPLSLPDGGVEVAVANHRFFSALKMSSWLQDDRILGFTPTLLVCHTSATSPSLYLS